MAAGSRWQLWRLHCFVWLNISGRIIDRDAAAVVDTEMNWTVNHRYDRPAESVEVDWKNFFLGDLCRTSVKMFPAPTSKREKKKFTSDLHQMKAFSFLFFFFFCFFFFFFKFDFSNWFILCVCVCVCVCVCCCWNVWIYDVHFHHNYRRIKSLTLRPFRKSKCLPEIMHSNTKIQQKQVK